ncbi:MAG TPA: tetraacyldisaccharide 4'-kinase [Bacteroidales bacterium]|nr:tetraacyldisaccharide 4'-kinase [Bacteroidales bacterium]
MILPRKICLWLPSVIYGSVTALRNRLYDLGILKSRTFPLPVICVGNITIGGTGKTPHVIYITQLLSDMMQVAVLSRGYLRKSRGFRPVRADDRIDTVGDEPLMMARRMSYARVFVDRDRVHGITEIMHASPAAEAIILDDGFQHRSVRAGMNIVLTSYDRLMTRDRLLPLGRLRENLSGMKRADVIIVTKVPPGTTPEELKRVKETMKITGGQSIFFTRLTYGKPVPLFVRAGRTITRKTHVVLVTGIADPAPMIKYLSGIAAGVTHISFPDHHRFKEKDLEGISSKFDAIDNEDKIVVTTEKDAVRIKEITNIADSLRDALYSLPVSVEFIEDEDEFIRKVYGYTGKDKRDG